MMREGGLGLRCLVALAAFLSLVRGAEMPVATPEEVNMDGAKLAEIQAKLGPIVTSRQLPGAVVMVARHGKIVYQTNLGYQSPNYIYRLFSQSKPVTSVGVLMLVDEGLINIDDPVAKYIPEFQNLRVIVNSTMGAPIVTKPATVEMTVRHLLTHTSGLGYGEGGNTTVDEMYKAAKVLDMSGQNLDEFINKLARLPLFNEPGTRWRYSVGYDVLGYICQKVSKMPFDQYLQEKLFGPLEMKDTAFYVPPSQISRLVPYYGAQGPFLVPIPNWMAGNDFTVEPKLKSGGGGLVSTARDFMRFAQMLLNGGVFEGKRYLKEETVKAMLTNQLPPALLPYQMGPVTFSFSGFGFGVAMQTVAFPGYPLGEISWGGAASTNFWISPEHDTVIIGMTQRYPLTNFLVSSVRPVYDAVKDKKEAVQVTPEGGVQPNRAMRG